MSRTQRLPDPVRLPLRAVYRRARSALLLSRVAVRTRDAGLARRGLQLQALSRGCFGGWVTPHPARWWEYPWVIREVERRSAGRSPASMDSGAGRSPVPVALARLGHRVTVADPNAQEQTGRRSGGEWDWTDYGAWGVETRRAGMEDRVVEPGSLGFVVSVSVIEHVPARVRRVGLARFAEALEPGGVAVFTIDLVRGGRRLWNRILDEEVEPLEAHGTVEDLVAEAAAAGLLLEHEEPCPISTDRQDILGLVFRKRQE